MISNLIGFYALTVLLIRNFGNFIQGAETTVLTDNLRARKERSADIDRLLLEEIQFQPKLFSMNFTNP